MEMILIAVFLGFVGLALVMFSPLIILGLLLEAFFGETKVWKWFFPPQPPPPPPVKQPRRRKPRRKTARQLEFAFRP
jgi:hypothetical protein